MTTRTDLANHALALLGEMPIASIDDPTSKPARVCRQFMDAAIRETLRLSRWNGATKRATLVAVLPVPEFGKERLFALPSDYVRLLEVNGEESEDSEEDFEIEGHSIAVDAETCQIRYVAAVEIGAMDALLQNAVALRLAAKVALSLTGGLDKAQLMESMFERALSKARQVDAQESGGRENSPWQRILSRSRLIRTKFSRQS